MNFNGNRTVSIEEAYRQSFYSRENVVLTNVPRPFALLSIFGSVYILRDILKSPEKRNKMCNKIMVALSISDVIFSSMMFVSSWAVPKGQCYGSAGNQATCTTQGFLNSFATVSSQFYNAVLALCYLLMVRYEWNEDRFERIQYYMLLFPLFIALLFTVPSLVWEAFNFDGVSVCSGIAPYPLWCNEKDIPCIRGGKLIEILYRSGNLYAAFTPQMICGSVILTSMMLLYWHVLKRERANDRYRITADGADRKYSNRVAMQGICYVWAFLLTWCTWIGLVSLQIKGKEVPFGLNVASMILMPLQGFFNSMVYLRPRCIYLCSNRSKRERVSGRRDRRQAMMSLAWAKSSRRLLRAIFLREDVENVNDDVPSLPSNTCDADDDGLDDDDVDPSTVFLLSSRLSTRDMRRSSVKRNSSAGFRLRQAEQSLQLSQVGPNGAEIERSAGEFKVTSQLSDENRENIKIAPSGEENDNISTATIDC